ncbi:MAG: ribonuclease III domain-containing protein [Clostridia bacterium]|nr:ribonuclease III domain-containing protein [Clostridia bacterium]
MVNSKMIEFIENPNLYNPLVLAYVGDSLYDIYVRSRLISENENMPVHRLHIKTTQYVKAHGQSEAVAYIEKMLTDEELAVFKRGRNAKSFTVPKNADVGEYRRATGFEALLGWLYMKGQTERLEEIMKAAYEAIHINENK